MTTTQRLVVATTHSAKSGTRTSLRMGGTSNSKARRPTALIAIMWRGPFELQYRPPLPTNIGKTAAASIARVANPALGATDLKVSAKPCSCDEERRQQRHEGEKRGEEDDHDRADGGPQRRRCDLRPDATSNQLPLHNPIFSARLRSRTAGSFIALKQRVGRVFSHAGCVQPVGPVGLARVARAVSSALRSASCR